MSETNIIIGSDLKKRCGWCGNDPLYVAYHDHEWGRPQKDNIKLFEQICLEGFQSGLSWITILRKRDNFRNAFDHFDYSQIIQYDDQKIENLLTNKGIIRHSGKIKAVINNARCALKLLDEYTSLADYFWRFQGETQKNTSQTPITVNKEAQAMAKDLKNRGWKFVGPTTCYAFMQAVGIVNDHAAECFLKGKI